MACSVKGVHFGELGRIFLLAVETLHDVQQAAPVLHPLQRERLGQAEVGKLEVSLAGIGDEHGVVAGAQKGCLEEGLIGLVDVPLGADDIGRKLVARSPSPWR